MLLLFLSHTETSIKDFMKFWRTHWPNESVPPKMHMLEDHILDFIRQWNVGIGFYGEQGGESIHAEFNNLSRIYKAVKPATKRLKSMLEAHYVKAHPKVQEEKPKIKIRGPYNKNSYSVKK